MESYQLHFGFKVRQKSIKSPTKVVFNPQTDTTTWPGYLGNITVRCQIRFLLLLFLTLFFKQIMTTMTCLIIPNAWPSSMKCQAQRMDLIGLSIILASRPNANEIQGQHLLDSLALDLDSQCCNATLQTKLLIIRVWMIISLVKGGHVSVQL